VRRLKRGAMRRSHVRDYGPGVLGLLGLLRLFGLLRLLELLGLLRFLGLLGLLGLLRTWSCPPGVLCEGVAEVGWQRAAVDCDGVVEGLRKRRM
jgi:hypothetical protein